MLNALRNRLQGSNHDAAVWDGPNGDVIAIHGADGRFEKLSEGALSVFGVPGATLVGRRLMDVIAPADQGRLLDVLARLAAADSPGTATFNARVRVADRLGPRVEMTLSTTRERGLKSVTRNVEQWLLREEKIRSESERAMDLAGRRSDHLANVSHEIRTPLNAVIGFADAIYAEQFGPIGNERYKDYVRVIHESGQHLMALVTDLLDLSKVEADEHALEKQPTDPRALVQICIDIMRLRTAEAGLTLSVEHDPKVDMAMLDPKIIRQILLNLLSNALKFTATGGVTVNTRIDGNALVFSVTDTGVGMSPDDLALVGTRFKQARSEGVRGARGTGLGLSLSKALARLHGGELRLMSGVGEGTTAMVRIPYETVMSDAAEEASNVTPISRHRRHDR